MWLNSSVSPHRNTYPPPSHSSPSSWWWQVLQFAPLQYQPGDGFLFQNLYANRLWPFHTQLPEENGCASQCPLCNTNRPLYKTPSGGKHVALSRNGFVSWNGKSAVCSMTVFFTFTAGGQHATVAPIWEAGYLKAVPRPWPQCSAFLLLLGWYPECLWRPKRTDPALLFGRWHRRNSRSQICKLWPRYRS